MSTKNNEIKRIDFSYNGKSLTFNKPLVMAIVNLTPDSFYDGSKYGALNDVVRDTEEKLAQGADIIDIGAASSRPGAVEISEEEEWRRLENVLAVIRKEFPETFISVDTYRSSIAQKCADLGADIINDISGGNLDPEMFTTIARLQIPYILMHMKGMPATMQKEPYYEHVVNEVVGEFKERIQKLQSFGFEKIILDPGFGFGKNNDHNYTLLKNLNKITELGFPVLAGVSRKSMINRIIGTNPVTALNGTTIVNTIALLNGSNILRAHDVREAKQAVELVEFYKKQ